MLDLALAFESDAPEYGHFDRVEHKLHPRPDLCAFLLLDKLLPGARDMISAARHDEFYLAVDCDALARVASIKDIRTLVRCGVRYSRTEHCLQMFA